MKGIYHFCLQVALIVFFLSFSFSSSAQEYGGFSSDFEYNDFNVEMQNTKKGTQRAWGDGSDQGDLASGGGSENPKGYNDNPLPMEDSLYFLFFVTVLYICYKQKKSHH